MRKITLEVDQDELDILIADELRLAYQDCIRNINEILEDDGYQEKAFKVQDLKDNQVLANALAVCCEYFGGEV